jgi:CheY-like chemotaxis protein/HEAT repeat protein
MHRTKPIARLALCLATLPGALLAFPSYQGDAKATFDQGVEMLARGRNDEALKAFQTVLNSGLSEEQAYGLFRDTSSETWLDMMRLGGDMELTARRLMSMANTGRRAFRDNADAIKAHVAKLDSEDVSERSRAIRALSAEHGGFAVPYMLPALADQGNDDRRVAVITALASMDTSVVPPLVAALDAPDAFLRRNVAFALGRIRDQRAAGALAARAAGDSDAGARDAAQQALAQIGGTAGATSAQAMLLQEGNDYLMRNARVLADFQYSDVVWSWQGTGLVATPCPRDLYADEMAKQSFYRALAVDPSSDAARAGIARAAASELARIEALSAAGGDASAIADHVDNGLVAAQLAGAQGLDSALAGALEQGDMGTAAVLARLLGEAGHDGSAALRAALGAPDAVVRGEAAIALANTARGAGLDPRVVSGLAESAGREVLRIALIVDANAARSSALSGALEGQGWLTAVAGRGSEALALVHRLAGLDALLVAESLPDMTPQQVLSEVRSEPRTANVPALLLCENPEAAAEVFGDSVQGMLKGAEDLSALDSAVAGALDGDRAQADELARRAAAALARVGDLGVDIGAARGALHNALKRPDAVALAACHSLAACGDAESAAALAKLAADGARSEDVRAAACRAAARSLSRSGASLAPEGVEALKGLMAGEGSAKLKQAAASALGAAGLSGADSASLLEGVRAKVAAP